MATEDIAETPDFSDEYEFKQYESDGLKFATNSGLVDFTPKNSSTYAEDGKLWVNAYAYETLNLDVVPFKKCNCIEFDTVYKNSSGSQFWNDWIWLDDDFFISMRDGNAWVGIALMNKNTRLSTDTYQLVASSSIPRTTSNIYCHVKLEIINTIVKCTYTINGTDYVSQMDISSKCDATYFKSFDINRSIESDYYKITRYIENFKAKFTKFAFSGISWDSEFDKFYVTKNVNVKFSNFGEEAVTIKLNDAVVDTVEPAEKIKKSYVIPETGTNVLKLENSYISEEAEFTVNDVGHAVISQISGNYFWNYKTEETFAVTNGKFSYFADDGRLSFMSPDKTAISDPNFFFNFVDLKLDAFENPVAVKYKVNPRRNNSKTNYPITPIGAIRISGTTWIYVTNYSNQSSLNILEIRSIYRSSNTAQWTGSRITYKEGHNHLTEETEITFEISSNSIIFKTSDGYSYTVSVKVDPAYLAFAQYVHTSDRYAVPNAEFYIKDFGFYDHRFYKTETEIPEGYAEFPIYEIYSVKNKTYTGSDFYTNLDMTMEIFKISNDESFDILLNGKTIKTVENAQKLYYDVLDFSTPKVGENVLKIENAEYTFETLKRPSLPKAKITAEKTQLSLGESVVLDASGSSCEGSEITFLWSSSETSKTVTKTFAEPAEFLKFSVTVTNILGETDTEEISLTLHDEIEDGLICQQLPNYPIYLFDGTNYARFSATSVSGNAACVPDVKGKWYTTEIPAKPYTKGYLDISFDVYAYYYFGGGTILRLTFSDEYKYMLAISTGESPDFAIYDHDKAVYSFRGGNKWYNVNIRIEGSLFKFYVDSELKFESNFYADDFWGSFEKFVSSAPVSANSHGTILVKNLAVKSKEFVYADPEIEINVSNDNPEYGEEITLTAKSNQLVNAEWETGEKTIIRTSAFTEDTEVSVSVKNREFEELTNQASKIVNVQPMIQYQKTVNVSNPKIEKVYQNQQAKVKYTLPDSIGDDYTVTYKVDGKEI